MKTKRKTWDVNHTGKGGPVRVPRGLSQSEQAEMAARILARRDNGKSGVCCIGPRLDSWSEDHSSHTYEAGIGYHTDNGTPFRNVWIYTTKDPLAIEA